MGGVVEVAVLGNGEEEEAVEDDDEGGEGARVLMSNSKMRQLLITTK